MSSEILPLAVRSGRGMLGRSMSTLQAFLNASRAALAAPERRLVLVLGNEACDLDSVACTLTISHHLSRHPESHNLLPLDGGPPPHVVPVLNVTSSDLRLRLDVVDVLRGAGAEAAVITRDDVDLEGAATRGSVDVLLVDHNVPSANQAWLARRVVSVIDHHRKEGSFPGVVRPVGSCATIVAEMCLAHGDVEPWCARMLAQAIVRAWCW